MTETRLRSFTHLAGYVFASLFIASLALQNLRYGFYELFFLASGMALLTIAGAGYTVICRRHQLSAPGHLIILAALNSGLVAAMYALDPPGISHWVMPLVLLNLLILPLRQGMILSLLLLAALSLFLLLTQTITHTVTISAGVFALIAVGALYIWHYDHMAQSAEDLAITDPVTGAHNARFLDETLQKEISRAIEMSHSLSVISLAIDYADEAEDLHGKAGMHRLLRDLTRHLFGVIRSGDSLYTLDDGEFFLILPFTPEEGARVIAERIRRTIAEQTWPTAGKVTVSLGCTTRARAETRPADLRKRVRQALEEAKRRGADSVWYCQGETRQS
ncbi:GGDEF domain-containing protein [Marinobacter orientalis]|uniref:diguanylate cyclase n=1 Tax=Marinobacter orientalis TaxID=1928859 RepID=A0A7Y0WSR1_9GAMM|nr:diguanylate cyclase [Marinobacter orientalis]NMT64062.1 diguanylate cyclase [Marinobacter orientalis]TGX49296.1 diguanylate cyclase [Marinobacter orientalis]